MADEYEKFRGNMERYEKDKADREDAEKWRHQGATRSQSREKPKEPEKKETVPAEHPFKK